ncbi:ArnT family glycosyltransferase [Nakamurella endophytica]|uniref:ArnT family glycosyltransferase n=1 Tax=Nakamurella endophytica TaxID=1748367 RepID=UPI00166803D5|nr:glycosyltransferase family 39 protein [Nakamurella endophytica]
MSADPGFVRWLRDVRPGGGAEYLVGAAVLVWGLLLALSNLPVAGITPDERAYLDNGWAYVHGDFSGNGEHPYTAKVLMGLGQLIGGHNVVADRTAAGLASVATGVVIWWWLRRDAGRATGLIGGALWLLLPRPIGVVGLRIDRFGLLEPFMMLFAVIAMAATRWWIRTGRRRAAVWAGVAIGLSVTSKVTTVVLVPVLLIAALAARPSRRTAGQAGLFAAAAAAVVVVTYLPAPGFLGQAVAMLRYQSAHSSRGHMVVVAGTVTPRPPWWANLYWMWEGLGVAATIALAIGLVLLAVQRGRPTAVTALVAANLAALAVFLLAVSSVALQHYYYALVPEITVLAALGIGRPLDIWLTRRTRPRPADSPQAGAVLRCAALAAVLATGVAAVGLSVQTATQHPGGVKLAAEILAVEHVPPGPIVVAGFRPLEYQPYLPTAAGTFPTDRDTPAVAVIVQRGDPSTPPSAAVLRRLRRTAPYYRKLTADHTIDIYLPTATP